MATVAVPPPVSPRPPLRPSSTSLKGTHLCPLFSFDANPFLSSYVISAPIVPYYYSQLIGDATNPPTLLAAADFAGMAIIDADPTENGESWYVNQNNL